MNSRASHFDRKRSQSGTVLIIVLWVALGLVSVTLIFGHSMFFEFKAADNSYAGRQAEQTIEGAIRYVRYVLANQEEPGLMPDPLTFRQDRVSVGYGMFWLLGSGEGQLSPTEPYFGLVDESSKLNLNHATQEMLEALPAMTPEFAAAIIDWRDEDDEQTAIGFSEDDEPTEAGVEDESYMFMETPYLRKDGPFETVDELRLVNGATPELLYGEDTNLNGVLDPNENDGDETPPNDNRDGALDAGILNYVTVYSRPPAADDEDDEEDDREDDPGQDEDEDEDEDQPGPDPDDEEIQGKINVNTASSVVLQCIPGIDAATADSIVGYRLTNADSLDSIDWISELIEPDAFQEAEPYLTVNTYQFMADIAAVGRNGRGYRRSRVVFDASGDSPVVRYRRDMTRSGWALGQTVKQQLQLNSRIAR